MYAFLGFVEDENLNNGTFKPTFVLYRMAKGNDMPLKPMGAEGRHSPKVLVTDFFGHKDLEEIMSHVKYDRTVYFRNKKIGRKQHRAKGAVCWFESDAYGDSVGRCLYVNTTREGNNNVPTLREILSRNKDKLPSEIWSAEIYMEPLDTVKKLHLPQHESSKLRKTMKKKENENEKLVC